MNELYFLGMSSGGIRRHSVKCVYTCVGVMNFSK